MNKKNTKKSLFLLMLTASACTLIWLFHQNTPNRSQAFHLDNQPNLYMSKAFITQYNTDGSIDYSIQSKHVSHQKKNKETTFNNPHIILYSVLKPHWKIVSNSGVRADTGETVTLSGDVVLQSIPQSKIIYKTIIKTQKMVYYPKKNLAISNAFTQYQHNHTQITGTGVTVNLKNNKINIKKQSFFRFSPATKNSLPSRHRT